MVSLFLYGHKGDHVCQQIHLMNTICLAVPFLSLSLSSLTLMQMYRLMNLGRLSTTLLCKMIYVFNQSSKFQKWPWNSAKFDAKCLLVFKAGP